MLQLKRFTFDFATLRRKKLNHRVAFPLCLNLGPYVAEPPIPPEAVKHVAGAVGGGGGSGGAGAGAAAADAPGDAAGDAALGAAVGTVVGLFMGLTGLLFMPLVGAAVGDYMARKDEARAVKVGLATWVGIMLGLLAKGVLAFMMVGVFAAALLL